MADTASLVVRVSSTGVAKVQKDVNSLTTVAKKATAAVAGLVSTVSGLNKLVNVTRQTDILSASLLTMTGSAENAKLAFGEIEKFAKNTPYALNQSVEAFTKLVSLGLTPSQKALVSYGNTASAMGKDLNQMIEAVADATTFEFERLKEFGIKTKQEGDQVKFTFQGVTTTVAKSSAAIEGYLQGIGDNNFAGAMANRMATLDGALANLSDSWDGLFRAVSSEGAGGLIEEQVRGATAAIDELNASISSGQALGLINAWGNEWQGTTEDIKSAITEVQLFINEKLLEFGLTAEESSSLMSDAFWQFPANVRAAVQVATVEVAGLIDKTKLWGEALNPENWLLTIDEFKAKYSAQFAAIDNNVLSTASVFLEEREKRIEVLNNEVLAAKKLREEYDNKQSSGGIDLGQFNVAPDAPTGTPVDSSKLESQKADAEAYLEQLRQSNLTEMQLIDTHEQEKIAKVQTYKAQGLIDEQAYQNALTEIETTAVLSRAEISNRILDEQAKNQDDIRKAQVQKQEAEARAKEKVIDDGIVAQRNMTTDLKTVLGEQNDLYKASAIVTATINTYQAATGAFAAMASIPYVGPALGAIAAGAAITAGLANVAAITGAREQGGSMRAGGAYQMAERGKAEVIVPQGASRARTASQMRDIMGQNGGGKITGVTIVNNTTGRADNAQTEQRDDGQLLVTIEEMVADSLLNPDSRIAKARKASSGQPGF